MDRKNPRCSQVNCSETDAFPVKIVFLEKRERGQRTYSLGFTLTFLEDGSPRKSCCVDERREEKGFSLVYSKEA